MTSSILKTGHKGSVVIDLQILLDKYQADLTVYLYLFLNDLFH